MNNETLIVIIILGFILYKLFSGGSSKNKRKQRRRNNPANSPQDRYQVRRTGRNVSSPKRQSEHTRSSFIQSAKKQESFHNYDEASRLYLRGGQVFSAAKMKAMKGPSEVDNVINIIRINAPDQLEMITRNLVNEFYYRLEKPATAAALLRGIGLDDEAAAVEVSAGIALTSSPKPVVSPPVTPSSSPVITDDYNPTTRKIEPEPVESYAPVIKDSIEAIVPDNNNGGTTKGSFPNTLMMASRTLPDNCIVCRRNIASGDSFIHCINCGKPGHYKHLAEMMKVTGKCPSCKERLILSMYDF